MSRWLRRALIVVVPVAAGVGFVFLFLHLSGPQQYGIAVRCIDTECRDGVALVSFLIEESGDAGLGGTVKFRYRVPGHDALDEWRSSDSQSLIRLGSIQNGRYELLVEAANDEGALDTASCGFKVDCLPGDPPSIEITDVQALCDRGLTNLVAKWRVSDDVTPTNEVEVRYEIEDQRTGEAVAASAWKTELTSARLEDQRVSSYVLRVWACDAARNEREVSREFPTAECPDPTPPEIYDSLVDCRWSENCGKCEIQWSVRDRVTPSEEIECTWSLDDGVWHSAERGNTVSFECLSLGEHYLRIAAEDDAGNVREAVVPVPVSGEIDRCPKIQWDIADISCDSRGLASVTGWLTVRDDHTPVDDLEVVYQLQPRDASWEVWRRSEPIVFSNLEMNEYTLVVRVTDPNGEDAIERFLIWADCRSRKIDLGGGAVLAGSNLGIEGIVTLVRRKESSCSWRLTATYYPSTFAGYSVITTRGGILWSAGEALAGVLYGGFAGIYLIPSSYDLPPWCSVEVGGEYGLRNLWGTGSYWEIAVNVSLGVCFRYGKIHLYPRLEIGANLGASLK